jgi:hypothetical protein
LDYRIRTLLKNHELKVVLDSPDKDYRFEYYTTTVKDRKTGELRYVRTYRLLDLRRGGVTQEPWDVFELEKQTTLVTGLLHYSRYQISKIVTGWMIKCPSCGQIMRGKIWEAVPTTCTAESSPKCRQRFDDDHLVEEILVDHAT